MLSSKFRRSKPCSLPVSPIDVLHRSPLSGAAMDAELLQLQRQFESAQQAKSSVRLSERNVVELVHKLQQSGFLDFDLLHTVSGKEYITPDQLRLEMEAEIRKSGRASLIDLSDSIGVDLYHVEKQAQRIVGEDPGLSLINGEIISQVYWDSVAEEINEKLQECSQISIAELAAQLHVGSELVVSILEPRLGTIVKGRLEGGQLYTPAYVSRITAMVRGAARGITVPTNLPSLWNSLQQHLQETDSATGVSVDGAFFQSIFNGLVKEEEILGSLRAGVQWTPAVFAHAQRESVDSFFSQNSFISYDVLHKLAIPQPKQYLQSRYPEGIPLDAIFVHPSMVEMLDAAIEDAIEHGNWIDSLSVLPSYIGGQDCSKILSLCPSVQKTIKSSKAVLLGETCIFSNTYIKDMFDKIEKELDTFSYAIPYGQGLSNKLLSANECTVVNSCQYADPNEVASVGATSTHASEKESKKKRGKVAGSLRTGASENDPEAPENFTGKSKKNQKKFKDMSFSDAKYSAKKGMDKRKEDNLDIPSEWISEKILTLAPDLAEMGGSDDLDALVRHLSSHLKPMLVSAWNNRRSTVLLENNEKRRRLLDNLQKQLDEVILDLQLYEKALDLFDDDPSTSAVLHKHLLKTMASTIGDKLLLTLDMENKMRNGIEVEDCQHLESSPLSAGSRSSLAKGLPGSLSAKAQAVVEALEGKRVEAFMIALRAIADESGMVLKKLDKKLERALLHSYRKDLMSQVSSETDPIALLPKVVVLLYMQVYNKALQAPGRAISVALSRLKDKVSHSIYKVLMDYHSATVSLLALQAAATEDEEDCTSDRILSKRELLESMMPELKRLVLSPTNS